MAEATRYLKSKKDQTVYVWHELLVKHEELYEVTEQEAFPERFLPDSAKTRSSTLADKLDTPDRVIEGATTGTSPELAKDAAKGLAAKKLT